ncbi:acyl-CoA dehydrogenase family protein [Paenibacillus sp.]|jgi:hypothetical protein|uniref:acyl-CoA dehydrogenase family protein n=1 Tax=Paenibacillus sp. TaxID=58172 RepID=UPI0028183F53|nr:acyl-CoA dehydrogenase family protein [Paenibacillus sp.]MDR0267490.1 hypothetical protein [Paenibacillus sp.]
MNTILSLTEQLIQSANNHFSVYNQLYQEGMELVEQSEYLYLYPMNQPNRYLAILEQRDIERLERMWLFSQNVLFQAEEVSFQPLIERAWMVCGIVDVKGHKQEQALLENNELAVHHDIRFLFLAGIQLSDLQQATDMAIEYSKVRKTFGVPIHQHQLVSNALVLGATEYNANKLYLLQLAKQVGDGYAHATQEIPKLRMIASSNCATVDQVAPVLGAYSFTEESGMNEHIVVLHKWSVIMNSLKEWEQVGTYGEIHLDDTSA